MKDLAELSPYMGIYYLSLSVGLLVNGMPLLASLIFSLILVLIVLWVWSFIYITITITHLLKRSNRDMNINIFGLSATLVILFFIIISR